MRELWVRGIFFRQVLDYIKNDRGHTSFEVLEKKRPQPCGCCVSVRATPQKPGSIKDVSVEVDLDLLF